jgi:hypothetical protein
MTARRQQRNLCGTRFSALKLVCWWATLDSLKTVKETETMPSDASLANLKPFVKGVSGNPGGRPKKILSDRYAALMETKLPDELRIPLKLPPGSLWGDAIAVVSARTALKSSETGVAQRKELREAMEGKSPVRFELHPFDELGVEFVVTYAPALKEKVLDVAPQLPAESSTVSEE